MIAIICLLSLKVYSDVVFVNVMAAEHHMEILEI